MRQASIDKYFILGERRGTSSISELVAARDKITRKVKKVFTSGTKNIWCVAHSMYCGVPYPSEHFSNQSVKVLSQISGLRIWSPLKKFGHEMKLKDLVYLVLLD